MDITRQNRMQELRRRVGSGLVVVVLCALPAACSDGPHSTTGISAVSPLPLTVVTATPTSTAYAIATAPSAPTVTLPTNSTLSIVTPAQYPVVMAVTLLEIELQ